MRYIARITLLLLFTCTTNQINNKELWRQEKYIGKLEKPKYVLVNIYRARSTNELDRKDPNFINKVIIRSMQSYAWHNVKILINSDKPTDFVERNIALSDMLTEFREYLKKKVSNRGYHMIFVYREKRGTSSEAGYAISNSGTDTVYSTGIVEIEKKRELSLDMVSIIFSHELGHSIGLEHVNKGSSYCISYDNYCIMAPVAYGWPKDLKFPPAFSKKAFDQLKSNLERKNQDDFTLSNVNLRKYQTCGNGMIDPGEECDCGFEENCILTNEINCCDINTCKLKNGAQCSTGECCSNCQFKQGNICKRGNACSFDATCSGSSAFCPILQKKADGTPCNGGIAYCADGKCPDVNEKCRISFKANNAHYKEECIAFTRNLRKYDLTPYSQNYQIPKCGILLCSAITDIYSAGYHFTLPRSRATCNYRTPETTDNNMAYTPNGFKCDENKMCLNNRCIDANENLKQCSNINCLPGSVCVMGECQSNHKDFTSCKNVKCPKNQICSKSGICVHYLIPEDINSNKKIPSSSYSSNTVNPPVMTDKESIGGNNNNDNNNNNNNNNSKNQGDWQSINDKSKKIVLIIFLSLYFLCILIIFNAVVTRWIFRSRVDNFSSTKTSSG